MNKKLKERIERLKYEIEDMGGMKSFLILLVIYLIIWPFLLLYFLFLQPLYRGVRMLIDAKELGVRKTFKKNFHPDTYKEEPRNKTEKEPFIPDGRQKQFKDHENWPDAYVVDNVAVYGAEGRTLIYVDERVEEFDIPEGVENIYHRCFACCDALKRVSIPSSVKRIGNRAFFSCVSLKDIVIPESVSIIDEEVFMNCSSLENIVLPSKTTEIPVRTFCNCRSLRYFKLPKETKIIRTEAFRRCYLLEQIETNEMLELILKKAFEDCHSLKEFIMPESVRSCSEGMFNGCHSLKHIHFSSKIKDFGGSCCRDCWSINQISMPVDEDMKIYAREKWEKFADEVDISQSENPIPESMFWTMEDSLFFGIPRLSSVCLLFSFTKEEEYTVPSFVTNIKRDAFTSCKKLRTLRLSPYIKSSSDPWDNNFVSYDSIYENWPQVEKVIFDNTLKYTEYAFGLIG